MSGEAGYTLVETLAALLMLGLAMGGLSAGVYVIGRQQAHTSKIVGDVQALRAAESQVEHLLARQGAIRSTEPERFSGNSKGFKFACDQARECSVTLRNEDGLILLAVDDGVGRPRTSAVRSKRPGNFTYRSAIGPSAGWPPETTERQALSSIALTSADGPEDTALFIADLWAEQPAVCAFDPVMQDCR